MASPSVHERVSDYRTENKLGSWFWLSAASRSNTLRCLKVYLWWLTPQKSLWHVTFDLQPHSELPDHKSAISLSIHFFVVSFTLFSAFVPHISKDTQFLLVRLPNHWKSLCHCSVCSVTGLLLWRRFLFQTEQGKDWTSWTSLNRSPHQTSSIWFGLLRSVSVLCPLRPPCTHVDLNQLHLMALWVCTHVWPPEGANVLNVNTSICVYLHRYLIYFLE